jgi:uncharacterized membrane protein YoaK (UPF0700 family)
MILGIGTPLEILTAIVVYMIAVVSVTELFKKLVAVRGGVALMLSWIVGIGVFIGLAIGKLFAFNFAAIILFMFVTGITNSIYRWEALREFIRKIFKTDF